MFLNPRRSSTSTVPTTTSGSRLDSHDTQEDLATCGGGGGGGGWCAPPCTWPDFGGGGCAAAGGGAGGASGDRPGWQTLNRSVQSANDAWQVPSSLAWPQTRTTCCSLSISLGSPGRRFSSMHSASR